jgi:hypothetical protein
MLVFQVAPNVTVSKYVGLLQIFGLLAPGCSFRMICFCVHQETRRPAFLFTSSSLIIVSWQRDGGDEYLKTFKNDIRQTREF